MKGHEKKIEPEVLTARFNKSAAEFSLVTTFTSTGKNYSKSILSLLQSQTQQFYAFFFFLFPEKPKRYLPGSGLHSMDPEGRQTLKEKFSKIKTLLMFYDTSQQSQEHRNIDICHLIFIHTTGYFSGYIFQYCLPFFFQNKSPPLVQHLKTVMKRSVLQVAILQQQLFCRVNLQLEQLILWSPRGARGVSAVTANTLSMNSWDSTISFMARVFQITVISKSQF